MFFLYVWSSRDFGFLTLAPKGVCLLSLTTLKTAELLWRHCFVSHGNQTHFKLILKVPYIFKQTIFSFYYPAKSFLTKILFFFFLTKISQVSSIPCELSQAHRQGCLHNRKTEKSSSSLMKMDTAVWMHTPAIKS